MRYALGVALGPALAFPLAAQEPARVSPHFEIRRVGGPPLPLNRYLRKVVALAFIDTGCPHCQDFTRALTPIAREYAPRGVQVLECAFNDAARQTVPDFVKQFAPPFPVGWATRAAVMAYLQISILEARPLYVPHPVLLDRRGKIRGDFPGESGFFVKTDENLRADLDKLLRPAVAKQSA